MTDPIDVYVVTYRSEAYLPRLLADLRAKSECPHNFRVVDNTGNRRTLTALWNDLWREGSCEFIAILNPDISLCQGWDAKLRDCLVSRPDVAVALANRYFTNDGPPPERQYNDLGEHLEGFYAFMARRTALERLNGFDERFRFYFADSDFQLRALKILGMKTTQVNHCMIGHAGAVSTREADRRGELDQQAEFFHAEEVKKALKSGVLRPWHELGAHEREYVRSDPIYRTLSGRPEERSPMKLSINDIYSPEGRKELIEAFTKSMWASQIHHRASWAGVPLLQIPEDMVMIAELVWNTKPSLIIECGVWKGGGLVFYASLLEMLGSGEVVGIDLGIWEALQVKLHHKFGARITLIEGSSADPQIVEQIRPKATGNVMVILDSNHSTAHVKAELANFAPLIKPGGYLIVLDGVMKILYDVPGGQGSWRHDNPETAVAEFLLSHPEFERDRNCSKFGATHAPGGFLRRK